MKTWTYDYQRDENAAPLHQIMTAPPTTAAAHAAEQRRRTQTRRQLEDLREQRAVAADEWPN